MVFILKEHDSYESVFEAITTIIVIIPKTS